ncbi:MAG TPA: tRNA (adenosine(37)-N6)-threonylcarbamoyltransferase complex transferase subunit TsaD [Candidatus Saccharimonadales bacterium]|nr:tRNA (adenosine(37)-N6)-threonylcarbamoyltransferase complex transferase subunit TsaD [Candidatus Saccharimonadales bacterium]
MNILGIETSCDETAAAVVQNGTTLLSNVVATQIDLHVQYGGVVPEVAARSHIEVMLPVVEKALEKAFSSGDRESYIVDRGKTDRPNPNYDLRTPNPEYWDLIDGIAVTAGPGLLGSLLIGTLTARTLAEIKNKSLYGINHVEAHVYANFIGDRESYMVDRDKTNRPNPNHELPSPNPDFPLLALIISGGHSQIVLFRGHLDYRVLGQTRDDAAGEAFDKIAKLLGLGFPGGPAIAKAALLGNDQAFTFPKAKLGKDSLDYSFSGVKTAVLRQVQQLAGLDHTARSWELHHKLTARQKNDLAASFQKTVVDTLVDRTVVAYERHHPKTVVIAGGVAANQALRDELRRRLPIPISYPPPSLCTDNAAMVAALGYHYALADKHIDPAILEADSSLAM